MKKLLTVMFVALLMVGCAEDEEKPKVVEEDESTSKPFTIADLSIYRSTNNKTLALSYLLQARAILLKTLGADHSSTKITQTWIDALQ
jgi:PBP1b-binding outer membrane lipoprotein LpoB